MATKYNPVTAKDKAKATVDNTEVVESDNVAALKNYENRSDVETLAQRRARENSTSFEETKKADEQLKEDAVVVTGKAAK